jgi:hypothetical protein
MATAVRNYAHYRASPAGWMLGRFVCPAASLDAFSAAADPLLPRDSGAIPWRVSVTGSGDLAADRVAIDAFNARHRVCFDECGAVVDAYEVKTDDVDAIAAVDAAMPASLLVYCELPLIPDLDRHMARLAHTGRRAKIRTGGTVVEAFPHADAVAAFLASCLRHDVPAKATAGLHHPVCGAYRLTYEDGAPVGRMFGFLNVLLATALLAQGGEVSHAIALLETTDPRRFAMNDVHVAWQPSGAEHEPVVFDRVVLQAVRARGLLSIGSCSFTEPVDESRALGWV